MLKNANELIDRDSDRHNHTLILDADTVSKSTQTIQHVGQGHPWMSELIQFGDCKLLTEMLVNTIVKAD